MQKCLGPRWLLMQVFVLDNRALSWAECVSLWTTGKLTGLTTSSVAFMTGHPSACTHRKWQYRLQLLLVHLAAANNFSRKNMFLQYSRCWVNGLSFLWKGNFYKPQGLLHIMTKPSLREHWVAGPCLTHTESGEERGQVFNNEPKAQIRRGENRIQL